MQGRIFKQTDSLRKYLTYYFLLPIPPGSYTCFTSGNHLFYCSRCIFLSEAIKSKLRSWVYWEEVQPHLATWYQSVPPATLLCDVWLLQEVWGKAYAFLRTLSYFSSSESPWGFHQMPPTAATVEKECWREAEPATLCRPHVTSPLLPLVLPERFLSIAAEDCYHHSAFTEKQSLLWKSHTHTNNQALLIR